MSVSFPFSGEPCWKTSALRITRDFCNCYGSFPTRHMCVIVYIIYIYLFNDDAVGNSDCSATTYNDGINDKITGGYVGESSSLI
jgi:hypothetical protein